MNTPDRPSGDDLAGLERRLSGWKPAAAALSRDRMLFEAGVASGRGRRPGWMATILAATAVGLGGWAVVERNERRGLELALAERTHALELALAPKGAPRKPPTPPVEPPPASELATERRLAILDPDAPASSSRFALHPASLGRVFTPLSSRDPGALAGL